VAGGVVPGLGKGPGVIVEALVHQLDQHRHGHQTGEHGAAYPGDQLVKAVSDKEQAKQVGT
jgi:hypothetical protein